MQPAFFCTQPRINCDLGLISIYSLGVIARLRTSQSVSLLHKKTEVVPGCGLIALNLSCQYFVPLTNCATGRYSVFPLWQLYLMIYWLSCTVEGTGQLPEEKVRNTQLTCEPGKDSREYFFYFSRHLCVESLFTAVQPRCTAHINVLCQLSVSEKKRIWLAIYSWVTIKSAITYKIHYQFL